MTNFSCTVHDATAFPVVYLRPEAVTPGFSAAWAAEMEWLCEGPAFVLVYPGSDVDEPRADFKARGAWLKLHHERLSRRCRLLVTVEPDADKRAAFESLLAKRIKAFGVDQACASHPAQAHALAVRALAEQVAAGTCAAPEHGVPASKIERDIPSFHEQRKGQV